MTCPYKKKGTSWSCGYHKGIDITCGDRILYSTCDGVVLTVGWDPNGWGQYVRIREATTGRIHIFAHLVKGSAKVAVNQKVSRKTIIGTMGTTGNSTGVHLHFQIEKSNTDRTVCDPTEWLGIPNQVGEYQSKDYQIKEDKDMAYKDEATIPAWAKEAVEKVTEKGWMQGDTAGNFRPNDPITRAEMAVVLARENDL
ncbi:MAG: peptidoglycan DD-metalloendopeptidase family protein [Oscillospiraceae bacterium]|nr:peptidoglycan DD-metalloendopeptidase family protein [Oscillospiraceae bacterium]